MEIRRLNVSDAPMLIEMVKNYKNEMVNTNVSEQFLQNPNNCIIACVDPEGIMGFVLGYILQRYDGLGDMMYLHEVHVIKEHRRRGIAKNMIKATLKICSDNDFSKMFLITSKSNKPALCLYEATGANAKNVDDIVYEYKDM